MPRPLAFLVLAVAAAPLVYAAAVVVTCRWYERVWLPRIAGED